MTFQDLQDLLSFAKAHNLMHKTFLEVYNLWLEDMADTFLSIQAENCITDENW